MRTNHVHIQLEGICAGGVIVMDKTTTSFRVVHTPPGSAQQCDAPFSYRITAKRSGFENLRLATPDQNLAATRQYLQSEWAAEVAAAEQEITDGINAADGVIPPGYTMTEPPEPPTSDDIMPTIQANQKRDGIQPITPSGLQPPGE